MEELGGEGNFEFSEKSIRMGFIRKVYGILCAQLVLTFGIVLLFTYVKDIQTFTFDHPEMLWISIGVTFACIIILACCGDIRRKSPWNFIFLFIFTLCEGYMLGCVAASIQDPLPVVVAMGITILMTFALTIFSFQTKWDFTMMGGMLFTFLFSLLFFGIFAGIFHSEVMDIMYSSLGVMLFSFYLVFDTQMMLGGKHRYALSPEEYVFAALNLYLDIINLFIHILALLSRN